jgi:hypothetical protein
MKTVTMILTTPFLPDKHHMAIRANFLRSVATQMAKLQTFEFDAAGTLDFDNSCDHPITNIPRT